MNNSQNRNGHRTDTGRHLALAAVAVAALLGTSGAPVALASEVELEQRYITHKQTRMTGGEELYTELCAVCHGQSGQGDGPAVPALRQEPVDLTLLTASNGNEFPRDALHQTIYGKGRVDAHGSLDMPVWGRAFEFTKPDWSKHRRVRFAKSRIDAIVDYIESLQVQS